MQRCDDELVVEEGADLVEILYRVDWSDIHAAQLAMSPGKLFPAGIGSLC